MGLVIDLPSRGCMPVSSSFHVMERQKHNIGYKLAQFLYIT
jgi:hypothetical protein